MSTKQIPVKVSGELYDEMMRAKQEFSFPSLTDFVREAIEDKLKEMKQQASYRRELQKLRQGIQESGGLKAMGLGETKEEIIASLRQARQQIFDEEYAHLYR
jgi:Arc/MetJ-type ribon-helix-helix transcriptional regulator